MRGKDLLDKMELVDSTFIESAENAKKKKNNRWQKWGAAAACVSAAAIIGVLAWRMQDVPVPIQSENLPESTPGITETAPVSGETEHTNEGTGNTTIGGISRDYKDISVLGAEIDREWAWDYKTLAEQYTTITMDDTEFVTSGRFVDASLLGEAVGTYDAVGYDYLTDKEYRLTTEVYRINGVSEDSIVAVRLDEDYVVFKNRSYDPPSTFGEMLDDYTLAENLPFNRFTMYSGHTDTGYFSLRDDWYIWNILEDCRDAAYVEDDNWGAIDGEYLSFTATSEALGAYKKVFYVTADGYVKTNVFEWGYTFNIGTEAAGQILAYAKENSTAAEREPYTNSLAGTLVEITDDYILADDTFLCTDANDGMIFRIPTDDLRISRCINNIHIGDVVVVNFTGSIDTESGNTVTGAYSLTPATIQSGEVWVLE